MDPLEDVDEFEDEELEISMNEVALDNSWAFCQSLDRFNGDVGKFVRDVDDTMDETANVTTDYDLDGVVVVLTVCQGVRLVLPTLKLLNFNDQVSSMFHMLKKTSVFRSSGAAILLCQNVHGMTVAVNDGYFLCLSLLPSRRNCASLRTKVLAAHCTAELLRAFKKRFVDLLRALSPVDMARETIKRNNTYALNNLDIVRTDQDFILRLLDEALNATPLPNDVSWLITLSKFGQKESDDLGLDCLADEDFVTTVAIHAAVTIGLPNVHLFWSRSGLQDLIGQTGKMFPVLSFRELANFQTSSDGQPPQLPAALVNLSTMPGTLLFMQLYTDLPHTHMTKVWRHPVSGSITTTSCLHHKTTAKLGRAADQYIAHLKDVAMKFCFVARLRLEIVQEATRFLFVVCARSHDFKIV